MSVETVLPPNDHPELRFPDPLRGAGARRVQEWLSLAGFPVEIDGEFGPESTRQLATYQASKGLTATGLLDRLTWATLTAGLSGALAPAARGVDFGQTMVAVATRWVGLRELPGNRGPIVRTLCDGNEGPAWAWCAGFVRQVSRLTATAWGRESPAWLTLRVTEIAQRSKGSDAFIAEREAKGMVRAGDLFLVRKAGRWSHTGLVVGVEPGGIRTIEGNTDGGGSREGDRVRSRVRPWGGLDFARVG
jgi:hypothetical protein